MDTDGVAYNLGIDGLPLGTAAVVAVDGAIVATFTVDRSGVRIGGLAQRIRDAVDGAEARMDSLPAEVRVVLVDDGTDGAEVDLARQWLAARSIGFHVLDLVGADGVEQASADAASRLSRSMSRAMDAALW